jgi:hypothetical protein
MTTQKQTAKELATLKKIQEAEKVKATKEAEKQKAIAANDKIRNTYRDMITKQSELVAKASLHMAAVYGAYFVEFGEIHRSFITSCPSSSKSYAEHGMNLIKILNRKTYVKHALPADFADMTRHNQVKWLTAVMVNLNADRKAQKVKSGDKQETLRDYLIRLVDPSAAKAKATQDKVTASTRKAEAEKAKQAEAKEARRIAKLERDAQQTESDMTNGQLINKIITLLGEAERRNLDLTDASKTSQALPNAYKVIKQAIAAGSPAAKQLIKKAA